MTTAAEDENKNSQQNLVLLGGGHAHIQVIKALNAANRPKWLNVTLIDLQAAASYSGMVPGCVAKFYQPEETLLQLQPLAEWAKLQFVNDEVTDIDLDQKLIHLSQHETPISFDCMSIDIGSTTRGLEETKGALEYTIPTRPISKLVERIEQAEQELLLNGNNSATSTHVVVIGGGAAGIELSLGIMGRWKPIAQNLQVTLLNAGTELVGNESLQCRRAVMNVLQDRNVQVLNSAQVTEITKDCIYYNDTASDNKKGEISNYTHCIWATGAGSHPLAQTTLQQRGLDLTKEGWIRVNPSFQSTSHPHIFAAGDCSSMQDLPNGPPPKAGVYAVRAGPVLMENLPRYCRSLRENTTSAELIPYQPQSDFLKLLICGDGKALGFRFGMPIYGKWVWELKDAIDQGFMDLFRRANLPNYDDDTSSCSDKSQYDSKWSGKSTVCRLEPPEAANYLLRTDNDVNYEQAWYTLREMTANETYRIQVMEHVKTLPIPIAEER